MARARGGDRAQPDAAAGGSGGVEGHCLGAPGTSTSHPSAFSSLGSARVGVTASCTRRGSRARAPSASKPRQREAQERARLAEAGKGEAEAPQPRGGSGGGEGEVEERGTRPPLSCPACVATGIGRCCCPGAESCPGVPDGASASVYPRGQAPRRPEPPACSHGCRVCSHPATVCGEAGGP